MSLFCLGKLFLGKIKQLSKFYNKEDGRFGKSIRVVVAILILSKLRLLSDIKVIEQIWKNRYYQYFCNVPDKELFSFLSPSSLTRIRQRYGIKGDEIIEKYIFDKLRKAGAIAECQGYFQEDEGFEKEPGLRTYTVVMPDPKTQLVWHMDYVDHVDEKTLCTSFKDFLQRINFNVKGVTKDNLKPSTNALKSVFYKVWIDFCHLHFLKKLNKAIVVYQKETKRPWKRVNELYKKINKDS